MACVLIVDDEGSIRETFGEILGKDHRDVFCAGDVPEALGLLEKREFDVVVTDVIMTGPSGLDLLSKIRAASERVQVIVITGEPTIETAAQAVRDGAFDYLAKPISGTVLRKVVGRAAGLKALLDEKARLEAENLQYRDHLEKLVGERTEELAETNRKLKKTVRGVVEAISLTVEKRDIYMAGHQVRVADLARAIGEEMWLPEPGADVIFMAGMVHDIGKICIPAEILSKPGRLSEKEFGLVKSHSQIGYDILRKVEFPWPIADIVLQHHERLDGSGYPNGISGEGILVEARILGVADTVEAMAQHRPHRPTPGLEKAFEELERGKGVLYDPDVVAACMSVFREKGFRFQEVGL